MGDNGEHSESTELITLNDLPVRGPDLPLGKICGHSMVKVNPKMIYIIGGCIEEYRSTNHVCTPQQ